MIFSHFELLKKKRIFHVSIFVYLAKLIMFGTDLELYLIKFLKSRGRTKRNKHLRLIDIIKRVMIGCLLSFKSDYEFHDSVDYFYDEKNRKYAKIKRKNMEKFIDGYYFIAFNNYSIDAFRLMIKFYKLNRGFLRNKICLLRHLALRAQFERVTMK